MTMGKYFVGKIGESKPHRISFRISDTLDDKIADFSIKNKTNKTDSYTALLEKGLLYAELKEENENLRSHAKNETKRLKNAYGDAVISFISKLTNSKTKRAEYINLFNEIVRKNHE